MGNPTATYSPEDNKLRLYPAARLDPETYARVKAAGFGWAPKQELFVAPMWTPAREDLLLELASEIGDEDTSLVDRAEQRAERFEDYSQARAQDAEQARAAVSVIADMIPFGQPILVGHHSEHHARADQERIHNGMSRAVKMWATAEYWTQRAAGAIRAAKYKERPDVRARRIKGLEADLRKWQANRKAQDHRLAVWAKPMTTEQALFMAGHSNTTSMDTYLGLSNGTLTGDQAQAQVLSGATAYAATSERWITHLSNRLEYERAMLAAAGGTVADRNAPEKGGAIRCWASPGYGKGWSYVQKVNKVSVTVLDNWGNGGPNFTRTIPLDKLKAVMSAAAVQEARDTGLLHEDRAGDPTGFYLSGGPGSTYANSTQEAAT